MGLTQLELGRRLAASRKVKGLSQEELAIEVGLSRSSLAQIELGNRGVDALELQVFARVLGFSLDAIMAAEFEPLFLTVEEPEIAELYVPERIAKPVFQLEKFKNVLLYFLEHCAGKPNVGEAVLYRLLYFADFNYYEIYEEQLTGASYRKLPFGPVPQKMDAVLHQMMTDGLVERIKTIYHGFPQTRYLPLVKADLSQLKASEKQVMDGVIQQMSDWSAKTISDYLHHDLPWEVTEEGKEIQYELALYREIPYSVRNHWNEEE